MLGKNGVGGGLKSKNVDVLFRGAIEMLTVADMGEGGVKNGQKSADVLYGRPLSACTYFFWLRRPSPGTR